MSLKTAILITLLTPILADASTTSRLPLIVHTNHENYRQQRSNTLGSQMNDLQGLVHKVALNGPESGRELSYDPDTEEAQNAEAMGQSVSCGNNSGTLNLVEHNRKVVLIGPAHKFYEKGELSCNQGFGEFYPDDHYYQNPSSGIIFNKSFRFKLPPLNKSEALKNFGPFLTSEDNLNDFVVLEIIDADVLLRQNGEPRTTIKIADIPSSELSALSQSKELILVSNRHNFHNRMRTSIEFGCQILNLTTDSLLKKHTCDVGNGTSGSSLFFVDQPGQLVSVGINYGSIHRDGHIYNIEKSEHGNYIIPSERIIMTLNELIPPVGETSGPITILSTPQTWTL